MGGVGQPHLRRRTQGLTGFCDRAATLALTTSKLVSRPSIEQYGDVECQASLPADTLWLIYLNTRSPGTWNARGCRAFRVAWRQIFPRCAPARLGLSRVEETVA